MDLTHPDIVRSVQRERLQAAEAARLVAAARPADAANRSQRSDRASLAGRPTPSPLPALGLARRLRLLAGR